MDADKALLQLRSQVSWLPSMALGTPLPDETLDFPAKLTSGLCLLRLFETASR